MIIHSTAPHINVDNKDVKRNRNDNVTNASESKYIIPSKPHTRADIANNIKCFREKGRDIYEVKLNDNQVGKLLKLPINQKLNNNHHKQCF